MVDLDQLERQARKAIEVHGRTGASNRHDWFLITTGEEIIEMIARIRELEALLDPLGKYVTTEMREHADQVKKDCING